MNNRFAVINFSPNLNIRRRTIKLRQLKAMFTFTTLRLHLHTIEYRMPLRGEFRLEIFQFPYWLSNPKFRPPALSFGAQKKFRSESLTVAIKVPISSKSGQILHCAGMDSRMDRASSSEALGSRLEHSSISKNTIHVFTQMP